jgi:hypothetical protein
MPKSEPTRVFLCCDPGEWSYKEVKEKLLRLPLDRMTLVVTTISGGMVLADQFATDTLGKYQVEHVETFLKDPRKRIVEKTVEKCEALVAFLAADGPELEAAKWAIDKAWKDKKKVKIYRREA